MTEPMIETSFSMASLEDSGGVNASRRAQALPKGTSYFRVAPPFGTNNNRALFHQYRLHWGFTGANGKPVPISCSYTSEGYCPVCKSVFQKRDELEKARAMKDEDLVKDLNAYIETHGSRRVFVYNLINLASEVVMVGVPKTVHDLINKKISEAVLDMKFDPTSLQSGVWLHFEKSGTRFSTEYGVDFRRITVNEGGEIIQKLDRTPIDAGLLLQIREQLANGGAGPLKDIHVLHEPRTAKELQAYMNGFPIGKAGEPIPDSLDAARLVAGSVGEEDVPGFAEPVTSKSVGVAKTGPANIAEEIARMRAAQSSSNRS